MDAICERSNHAVSVETLATWLLASGESMTEAERNRQSVKSKSKAAMALIKAIEDHSPFPGDKELCAAAKISQTQLWKFRNEGFTAANKKIWGLAKALGVDAKALIRGEVIQVKTTPSDPKESDLVADVRSFVGTSKETLIRKFLEALKSGG